MLALLGGKPMVDESSKRNWPVIDQDDIDSVVGVLKSGVLGGISHPAAQRLEKAWAEWVGVRYCLAVNSGTAALHCALAAAGIEPGNEVLAPAYTFGGAVAGILHHNAIPVFVDVDPNTYNIDPNQLEKHITDHTKAILAIHMHGLAADMDPIRDVARRHGLAVVEDACQGHGATYKGKRTGSMGAAAGFSLQTSKVLMAGEGGLITTDDDAIFKKAAMFRIFGELIEPGRPRTYNSRALGWMYRPAEIVSALAYSQLGKLETVIAGNQANAARLTAALAKLPGVIPPYVPPGQTHTYYMYRVRIDPRPLGLTMPACDLRRAIQRALQAEGVTTFEYQTAPLPQQTVFQEQNGYGKGCPWSCPHARPGIRYNPDDFPGAWSTVRETFVVGKLRWPNGAELMEMYIAAFRRVMENLDAVIADYNRHSDWQAPQYATNWV